MRKLTMDEIKKSYSKVYNFIINNNLSNLKECRYELGEGDYVNIESYFTYDYYQRQYESHRRYRDIQVVIEGRENIIVESINKLVISKEYDDDKDIIFYKNDIKGKSNYLSSGEMLLLDPEDGHMPCVSIDESVYVKKAVFKILV